MKSDSKYKIEFAGLKIGSHQFNFNADKQFFDRFNFSDFNDVLVNIDIDLIKKWTLLELEFVLKGVVNVNCDLTNELGLTMDGSGFGLGNRCKRFAMIIDNGVVQSIDIEEPGAMDVSSAESQLAKI